MKNYRTTLVGAALAGLTFVSQFQANGGNLADWKLWVIPFLIAVLGYVAKDAGAGGSIKLLAGCLALLTLPSCSTVQKIGAALSTPKVVQIEASLADLAILEAKAAGKISEGDAVAIHTGVAIITSPGSTISKVIPLTDLVSETAVSKGLLTPGTGLIIKATTALVIKPIPAVPTPTAAPQPTIPTILPPVGPSLNGN